MKKKPQQAQKKEARPAAKPAVKTVRNAPGINLPVLVLFLFALAIYGNSLLNDYALDDLMVIQGNTYTQKGISGIPEIFSYDSFTGFWGKDKNLVVGGRYRPLSIATFAVERSVMGGFNPFVSHLVNMLLYALTGILLFLVFSRLVKPPPGQKWYLGLPFVMSLLFLAHPVHTEVVANIKGRDEIFALLFSLLTLYLMLLHAGKPKAWLVILAGLCFFLGLLSKENAIMFVAIVPLTIHFFTQVPLKKNLVMTIPLVLVALLFIYIRFLVLGQVVSSEIPRELLNNPFLDATVSQRYGTILYTLGLYIKLLFFPHPLTHDYYPYQVPLVSLTDLRAIIPLLLYSGMIVYAAVKFRGKGLVAFGIIFYLVTLVIVSNLLFPVGTFMNERFIYMPSVGFVIVMTYLITIKLPGKMKNSSFSGPFVTALLAIVLVLFSLKTWTRNEVWKNDLTLFSTDVKVSSNSIKCNISAGGDIMKNALAETDTVKRAAGLKLSWQYLTRAIELAPNSVNALVLYGNINAQYRKDYKTAVDQYIKVLGLDPHDKPALGNAVRVLELMTDPATIPYRISAYRYLKTIDPGNVDIYYNLGEIYGRFAGKPDSASVYLEEAIRLAPKNIRGYIDLGIVYSMKHDFTRAVELLNKAAEIDPNDQQVKQNLAVTYRLMQQGRK